MDWLTDWLHGSLIISLMDCMTDCMAHWLTHWWTDWLTDSLHGSLTNSLMDWLTHCMAHWLTHWLTDWLTAWTHWWTAWQTDWLTAWQAGIISGLGGGGFFISLGELEVVFYSLGSCGEGLGGGEYIGLGGGGGGVSPALNINPWQVSLMLFTFTVSARLMEGVNAKSMRISYTSQPTNSSMAKLES